MVNGLLTKIAFSKDGLRLGRMEKPESGTGTGTGTLKIDTGVNWETLKPVPDARVEIKFKMASSVIIVLRNFQHSHRDTKDVLTARKSLPLVI